MPGDGKEKRFFLNGEPAAARGDDTVLDVARRRGVHIPTLCHHDAVAPYGACRICIVEVAWGKRSKMVTSCIYRPFEDDRVETDNQRVRRARRMTLELLLARSPNAEPVRALAAEYGVERPRFPSEPPACPENCILCGRCVRVCDEVIGQSAIGFGSRGPARFLTTPFGQPAGDCIGCGACVAVCPAGALHYRDAGGVRTMLEFGTELSLVACRSCGRFFVTAKTLEKVRKQLKLPPEIVETCPQCRAASCSGTLGEALVTTAVGYKGKR